MSEPIVVNTSIYPVQNISTQDNDLLATEVNPIIGEAYNYYVSNLGDKLTSSVVFKPVIDLGAVTANAIFFGPTSFVYPNIIAQSFQPQPLTFVLAEKNTGNLTNSPIAPKLRYYNLIHEGVQSVNVTQPGSGYSTPPSVNFTGGLGFGANATSTLDENRVGSISITNSGKEYVSKPTVTISEPDQTGGIQAEAEAVMKPITQNNLVSTKTTNFVENYVKAEDAIFSSEKYVSFYVRNQTNRRVDNIFFWINGGQRVNVDTPVSEYYFYEADFFDHSNLNVDLENYKKSGPKNTSLFNQIKISHASRPKNLVASLDNDIVSNLNFKPANEKLSLPNLQPDDAVAIYLKIETQFNINQAVFKDYSFFHMSYLIENGEYASYPGQVYSNESLSPLTRALPSVILEFETNYQRLLELINETTEDLYHNYPPFFSYYDES